MRNIAICEIKSKRGFLAFKCFATVQHGLLSLICLFMPSLIVEEINMPDNMKSVVDAFVWAIIFYVLVIWGVWKNGLTVIPREGKTVEQTIAELPA